MLVSCIHLNKTNIHHPSIIIKDVWMDGWSHLMYYYNYPFSIVKVKGKIYCLQMDFGLLLLEKKNREFNICNRFFFSGSASAPKSPILIKKKVSWFSISFINGYPQQLDAVKQQEMYGIWPSPHYSRRMIRLLCDCNHEMFIVYVQCLTAKKWRF